MHETTAPDTSQTESLLANLFMSYCTARHDVLRQQEIWDRMLITREVLLAQRAHQHQLEGTS